jgi:hypothetical protein
MLNSRLNLANDAQIAANKMLDRSPRGSVSNFRIRVGGGSVNIGVRPQKQNLYDKTVPQEQVCNALP